MTYDYKSMNTVTEGEPVYFAACSFGGPVFDPQSPTPYYGTVRFCDYRKQLDCASREEAEQIVARMNAEEVCPECGAKNRFKVYTQGDFVKRDAFVKKMNSVRGR